MQEPKTLLKYPENPSQVSFPAFKTEGEKPKNPVEKFLSLFADVRAGEGISALLLGLNVFLLLTGYAILKAAREPLILTKFTAEEKAYAAAGQALLLLLAVPFYGWFATQVNRLKLLVGLNLFFASNLVLFSALAQAKIQIGVVFYVWLGIFSLFVISQFWAFANDVYAEGQGRRLFPMIAFGQSLGAVAGASVATFLFARLNMPPEQLMLLTATALLASIAIIFAVNQRETGCGGAAAAREAVEPLGSEGGFQLLLRDRYLFWIAVLTLLLNTVNTSGEFVLSKLVQDESIRRYGADLVQRGQFIGTYYGSFQIWMNTVGLLTQLLLVSRLIRYAGVLRSLFILPCISLTSYSVMAFAPVLALVRSTDHPASGKTPCPGTHPTTAGARLFRRTQPAEPTGCRGVTFNGVLHGPAGHQSA